MMPPVEVLWIGHAGILVRHGDVTVAVDPFLDGTFCWSGKVERYLGKSPWIGETGHVKAFLDAFGKTISAVCITHAHGDHFDPSAILAIHERSPAIQVLAPLPVTRWMQHAGISGKQDGPRLVPVRRGMDIEIRGSANALRVGTILDPNFPCIVNPRRVGYLVYPEGGAGVAHLGDSHGPDPSWKKYREHVGGIVAWLREKPGELLSYFISGGRLARIWYIHWESFQPGHFDCNQDPLPRTNDPAVPPGMAGLLSYTEWSALPGFETGKNK